MAAQAALVGCGGTTSRQPDTDVGETIAGQPCSELEAAINGWLGKAAACQRGPDMRELLPIGDGFVLDWTTRTQEGRIWAVGTDPPLGVAPITGGPAPGLLPRTTIVPIGKRRVLMLQSDKPNVSIFTVNVGAPRGANVLVSTLGEAVLEEGSSGHGFVGLDGDYFLDYRTGNGTYNVHRVDETARDTAQVITGTEWTGVNPALRRGARIINLGQHRLLEWVPITGQFHVWSYTLQPGRADIFEPQPLAAGQFADLTPDHEIVVVTADRILIWERNTGRVVLRALDPTAADPLGGAVIGDASSLLLRSPDWTAPVTSAIENVVLVLQQGRSFDAYFGLFCQAAPGSNPGCEDGPACCEGMPPSIPGADACTPLDPTTDAHVPKDDFACLNTKMQGGQTGGFAVPPCGDPADFACAPPGDATGAVPFYQRAAAAGSLADRYFQSTRDGIEPNLIYLAKTAFGSSVPLEFGLQLTRVMAENRVRWALYLGNASDTRGFPPPVFFDRHWDFFRGVDEIARDVELQQLPAISIVIAGPAQSEKPGAGPAAAGIHFVEAITETIAGSARYSPTTLVLVTHLTSGGFFDHVAPPSPVSVTLDTREGMEVAYGPRVPLLALGHFARPGHVSHAPLELSSITKFLEWNWLGGETGQLGHRDTTVANIGSLLDSTATRVPVP